MPRSNLKKGRIKSEKTSAKDGSSQENEESTSLQPIDRAQLHDRNLGESLLSKIPPCTVNREDLSANLVSVASALVSNSAVNLQMAALLAQAAATMTGLVGNRSPLELITQTLTPLGFSLPSIPTSVPFGLIPGCSSAIHEPLTSDPATRSTSSKTDDSERSPAGSDGSSMYDAESHGFDTSIKHEPDLLQDSDRGSQSTEVTQSISSTYTTSNPRECTNALSTPDVTSDISLSPNAKEGLSRQQSVVVTASTPLPTPLTEQPNRSSTPHTPRKFITCTLCNKTIQRSSLREHMILHTNTGKYPCPICSKKCICASTLKQHLRVHTGERPFKCPQCPKAYKQHGMLKRHLLGHSGKRPYVCRLCGFAMHTRTSLTRHFRTHGIQKTVAEAPELWFKSDAPADTVFNIASSIGLVQNPEGATTLSQRKANPDPVANSTDNCSVRERRFVCDVCPAGFPSKQAMQSHRRHTHGQRYPYKCYECDEVFSNVVLRSAHASVKHPHVCPHCSEVMLSRRRGTLKAHIREKHPELSDVRPPTSVTNNQSTKCTDKTDHLSSNSGDTNTGLASSHETDDSIKTTMAQPTHLITAGMEHIIVQPAPLEAHNIHSESQSTSSSALSNFVKCDTEKLKSNHSGHSHRLSVHRLPRTDRHRFTSPLSSYTRKFCHLCPRMFTRSKQLIIHIRWHLGAKLFKCPHCSKAFRRQGNLKLHIKVHEGMYPYTCRICSLSFGSRAKLSCHLGTHRVNKALDKVPNLWSKKAIPDLMVKGGQVSQNQATRSSIDLSPSTLLPEPNSESSAGPQTPSARKFLCDICSVSFSNYQGLRSHQLRLHGAYCPHKCTECDERFSNFKAMRAHRHKQHPFRCPFCSEAMPRRITTLLESHIRCFHPEQFLAQAGSQPTQQLLKNEKNRIHLTSEPPGDTTATTETEAVQHSGTQMSLCENRELQTSSSASSTTSNINQTNTSTVSRTKPNDGMGSDLLTTGSLPPRFRCAMCPEAFATYAVLQSHQLSAHGTSLPYKCPECGEVFSSQKRLKIHCRRTHPLKCRFCSEVMPQRRVTLLESHVRRMHPEQCSTSWPQSANQPKEPPVNKQDCCPRITDNPPRDTLSVDDEKAKADSDLFYSEIDTNGALMCHTQSADSPSQLCRTLVELESPSSVHNLEARCDSTPLCQSISLGTPVLKPDLEKFCASHEQDAARNRPIQRQSLAQHTDNQHGNKNFPCPHCPKTFNCSSMLARHAGVHTGDKRYKCPHCPRVFKYRKGRRQHQRCHNGLRSFICRLCGLPLASGRSLSLHLQSHTIKKPISEVPELWSKSDAPSNEVLHMAAQVGRAITEEEKMAENVRDQCQLTNDILKQIAIRTRKYLCALCPAGFPSSSALRSHRIHTHKITGSVKCGECNEVFVNRYRYKIHLRSVHPLVCPVCSAVMPHRLRSLLSVHIRENHIKQGQRDPSPSPSPEPGFHNSSEDLQNLDTEQVQSTKPASGLDVTASEQSCSVVENSSLSSNQTLLGPIQKIDEHTSEQTDVFLVRFKEEELVHQ